MVGGSKRLSQKRWAAKVKTGCLTCKKRRVKCDEGRPSCQSCLKHKVECGGYPDLAGQSGTTYAQNASSSEWDVLTPESMSVLSRAGSHSYGNPSRSTDSASLLSGDDRGSSTSRSQSNDGENARTVVHYHSAQSIAAWTESFSPYQGPEQRTAMKSWMELAPSMSRSQQGLEYWTVLLPTIAWTNRPVRNAMTAVSLITLSLRRKDDVALSAAIEARALQYAGRCIRELIAFENPPESVIGCSSLFWIFEMCIGSWANSMLHLAAGNKIAKHTKLSTMSEPLAAQYVRSFVGDFPPSVHPEAITSMSRQEQEAQCDARHRYALFIMRDALDRLDVLQYRLDSTQNPRKHRAIQIVSRTARELQRLYNQWPIPIEVDENAAEIQSVIAQHSPFLSIIEHAEAFFVDDDLNHITRFEVQFKPCIDQFMWLAACLHLRHRQEIIEIWNVKRPLLTLTNRVLPTTEVD